MAINAFRITTAVACSTCVSLIGSANGAPTCFDAQEIPLAGSAHLVASAMDDSGRITGTLHDGDERMTVMAGGGATILVTLLPRSEGLLLNDVGQAAGLGSPGLGQHDRIIRVEPDGTAQILTTVSGSGGWSTLLDMNDNGSIVGNYSGGSGSSDWQAFIWSDSGGLVFIEPTAATTYARAVDADDRVAGMVQVEDGYHAMVWQAGELTDLHDALALSGISTAWAFDPAGRVLLSADKHYFWHDIADGSIETVHEFPVGSSLVHNRVAGNGTIGFSWSLGGIPYAGRWRPGTGFESIMIEEPLVTFEVRAINDAGHIAGSGFTLPIYDRIAMLWADDMQPIDLESFLDHDPISSTAPCINDAGQILLAGNEHWLLTPRCEGELDGSGQVDIGDMLLVIARWGTDGGGVCEADADGSGTVDVNDLLVVIAAWSDTCP